MARTKRTPTRTHTPPITYTEIPMKTPNRDAPSGKTLIDLIDTHRPRDPSGTPIPSSSTPTEDEEEIFGPGMQALCLTVPFCMLLGAFDYLVHLQYRQEVDLRGIIWKVIKSSPRTIPHYQLLYICRVPDQISDIHHKLRFPLQEELAFRASSVVRYKCACWMLACQGS